MKQKSKIIIAIAILTLTITNSSIDYKEPCPKENQRQKNITAATKVITPPTATEPHIPQTIPMENEQSGTHNEPVDEIPTEVPIERPQPTATAPPQPTEKETTDNPSTADTETATKPTTPLPTEPSTPKNGDVRIINGKQQGYLLGFGWVDYMGENECIYCEGMYENGNKVGIMGGTIVGSDGDINKQVGIMG